MRLSFLFRSLMLFIFSLSILLSRNMMVSSEVRSKNFIQSDHLIHHHHSHHQKESNDYSDNKEHKGNEKQCCHYHGEKAFTIILNSFPCLKKDVFPHSKSQLCFWETFFLNEPLSAQTNRIIDRSFCLDPPEIDCIQQAFFKSTVQLL